MTLWEIIECKHHPEEVKEGSYEGGYKEGYKKAMLEIWERIKVE